MGDHGTGVADVMRALADADRLRVVEMLSEEPRRAGELASSLGVTPAAMSKHLRVLLRAGIVADERPDHDARVRIFRLRPDSVAALGAWLDQVKAQWDEQLGSFKAPDYAPSRAERPIDERRAVRHAGGPSR